MTTTTTTRCIDRLAAYLREHQVPFEVQHHPVAYTAQEVAQLEHISGQQLAKVVMLMVDGQKAMLVLPATHLVDVPHIADALAVSDARLADEAEFAHDFPDCEVGAMPPFGNLYGIDVFVDRSLTQQRKIVFRAGTHSDTMTLAYSDFAELVVPRVVEAAHHR